MERQGEEEGEGEITAETVPPSSPRLLPRVSQIAEHQVKSAGSTYHYLDQWKTITSNPIILEWLRGYRIPFRTSPVQRRPPKVSLCQRELHNYEQSLTELLKSGAIAQAQHTEAEFLSSYFLLQKPDGSFRFILNLKALNRYIETPHFKLEDYRTVAKLLQRDQYLTKIDLRNAYYTLSIHHEHRRFLRFEFQNALYEFTCLPFGLSIAPYVFTKLLRPVIKLTREQGICCVIYLDDILLIANTLHEAKSHTQYLLQLLKSLGFSINYQKCTLEPSQQCVFLGFSFNSLDLTISLPREKRLKLFTMLSQFSKTSVCKIQDFARLVGTLIAACPAVNYGWAHTKLFEREKFLALKKSQGNFNSTMHIRSTLTSEFQWWLRNILDTKTPIRQQNFLFEIYSDASRTGWGASCQDQRIHGFWNHEQQDLHINQLELLAAYYSLKSFTKDISNCEILLRIDNITTIAYINRMGGVRHNRLGKLARNIWDWCERKGLWVYATYINTKSNIVADSESRTVAIETEYELSDTLFETITAKFGDPDIDLFATYLNKKCKVYISWKPDPSSLQVDAFTVSWSPYFFYAFPPFCLITNVLRKIIKDKARGIVIVPRWTSQPWYPLYKQLLEIKPLLFQPAKNMLLSPFRKSHPLWNQITLEAGILSGRRF